MKLAFLSSCLIAVTCGAAAPSTVSDEAQRVHARGSCGSLGPGTGLVEGKGWIVSMMPGKHVVRVRGGGDVFLTAARTKELEFDSGRPYYVVVDRATPASVLEWKVPGKAWAPVERAFLYPPQGVTYAR